MPLCPCAPVPLCAPAPTTLTLSPYHPITLTPTLTLTLTLTANPNPITPNNPNNNPNLTLTLTLTTGAILELQDGARAALPSCSRAPPTSALPHIRYSNSQTHEKPEFASCYTSANEWAPSARAEAGSLRVSRSGECLSVALSVASCNSSLAATGKLGNHARLLGRWKGRSECKRRLSPGKELQPGLVIRARTATSNSMFEVRPATAGGASPISPAQQQFLRSTYAISTALLERANRWLVGHEPQVAASQLEGRCNPGFSCKKEAAAWLLQLARKGRRLRADSHDNCERWQMGPE